MLQSHAKKNGKGSFGSRVLNYQKVLQERDPRSVTRKRRDMEYGFSIKKKSYLNRKDKQRKKEINMLNPAKLMKLKQAKDVFVSNHPKFPAFLNAVGNSCLKEDTIIEFKVTTKEGQELTSNIKLKESDLELLQTLKDMR